MRLNLLSSGPQILLSATILFICSSCSDEKDNINITTMVSAADGLDLKAVAEVLKDCKDAESLEKKLNASGGVNNLDLDENGKVDYIRVTEYGDKDNRGFSLSVELEKGEEQEIATMISKR